MSAFATFATDDKGHTFSLTPHAADRLREMDLTIEHARICITDPDERPRSSAKYPDDLLWCRAHLALPARLEDDGASWAVLTALPRTREAWIDLHDAGRLGEGRSLRSVAHLPSKSVLRQRGAYRPFPPQAREIGELREACQFAQQTLLRNPASATARRGFERMRVQLAAALKESA